MMELLHFWPSSVTLYANLYHIRNILNMGLTIKSNNNSCKVFLLTYFLLCITVRYCTLLKTGKFKGCVTTEILIVGSTRLVASIFKLKSIKGVA